MKILLLFVGKTKNPHVLSLLQEYEKRIQHFCELSLTSVRPAQGNEVERIIEKEGEILLARMRSDAFVVALDPSGESLNSERFAALIEDKRDHSLKDLVFVVGSHLGLADKVKRRANRILSLSAMTFNHEVARLLLVEQIYRALTLIHHIPYHK